MSNSDVCDQLKFAHASQRVDALCAPAKAGRVAVVGKAINEASFAKTMPEGTTVGIFLQRIALKVKEYAGQIEQAGIGKERPGEACSEARSLIHICASCPSQVLRLQASLLPWQGRINADRIHLAAKLEAASKAKNCDYHAAHKADRDLPHFCKPLLKSRQNSQKVL